MKETFELQSKLTWTPQGLAEAVARSDSPLHAGSLSYSKYLVLRLARQHPARSLYPATKF